MFGVDGVWALGGSHDVIAVVVSISQNFSPIHVPVGILHPWKLHISTVASVVAPAMYPAS